MTAGEGDLGVLLSSISPYLHEGIYVFCEVPRDRVPSGVEPVLGFQEAESTTLVITKQHADANGLVGSCPSAWITLGVVSDLAAVGFLAVITARLAAEGISSNAVSACRHDHLFVPAEMAERAMAVLRTLEELHQPCEIPLSPVSAQQGRVEVRTARPEDTGELCKLWELCGLGFDSAQVAAELDSCRRLHGEIVLVATVDSTVVGSLWATFDGRRGWLQKLATHPQWRSDGIGRALVAQAEARLSNLGARKINLLVEGANESVAGFYRQLGYSGETLVFMQHRLSWSS